MEGSGRIVWVYEKPKGNTKAMTFFKEPFLVLKN